jgi:flagellar protein FlbD
MHAGTTAATRSEEDLEMIGLTRTTGERCCLDPAQIERVEPDPDTVVYLSDGAKYVVTESTEQVIATVRAYRAAVMVNAWRLIDTPAHRAEVTGSAIEPPAARPRG